MPTNRITLQNISPAGIVKLTGKKARPCSQAGAWEQVGNLVKRADQWRWSSVWRREHGGAEARALLSRWPLPLPADWLRLLHQPQSEAELQALRRAVGRGCPYGGERWQRNTAVRLGLELTLRPRGRPKKNEN